jgi:ribosomal protein S18 acetylase RimI-like enzyme
VTAPQIAIREIEPDEPEVLAAALSGVGRAAAATDIFLTDPRAHAFVALEGEEPVGFAYGYEMIRPEGFWMLLLYEIDVVEEARRRGVGRQLLDAFVELGRSKGHRKMWLFTDAGNDAARRLYEGAGGERTDGHVGYWWVFE